MLQSLYVLKTNKRKSEFAGLMPTKEKSLKEEDKQIASLKHLFATLVQCSVAVKICMVVALERVDNKVCNIVTSHAGIIKICH